jgi:hypothetical protein
MRVVSMSGEIVDAGEEILNEKACGSLIGTPGESFNHKEHEGTQRKAGMDARSLVFSSRGVTWSLLVDGHSWSCPSGISGSGGMAARLASYGGYY